MKHFIIEVTYKVPIERILKTRVSHREYLEIGMEQRIVLFYGAQKSGNGGIVVARASATNDLESFFKKDPYYIEDLASYRFIEFEPAKYQGFLKEWID